MKTALRRVLAASFLTSASALAAALDCGNDDFKAVTTVAALPRAVRDVVLRDGEMADQGSAWQWGDVGGPERLPYRHLALAALGHRHIFVAIEIGGGPHFPELWSFELTDGRWTRGGARTFFETPVSLPELLYPVCDGAPKPDPRPERAVTGVVTSSGSVVLELFGPDSSVSYKLNRDPASRGTHKYDEIAYLQTGKPLSEKERTILRSKLASLQGLIPKANAAYQLVSEYLKVLDSAPVSRPSGWLR